MKPKLLIIPSWYISPNDRINGSFFQAQGALMSDDFETRVIYRRRRKRPSIRKTLRNPRDVIPCWLEAIGKPSTCIDTPNDEVFNNPKLQIIEQGFWRPPWRSSSENLIQNWVLQISEAIKNGWRPDLIRAHSAFPAGIVAKRVKSKFEIPYIISEHLPFSIYKYDPRHRNEIVAAFENADLVLSLSYDKVRQLAMSGIDVEPNIIYNFIDETLFTNCSAQYLPGDPLRLVTIGAASFYKDHKTLLRAMRHLADNNIPFHLTMIGLEVWGGDKLKETMQLIDDLELTDRITIHGKLSRLQVAEILPRNHIYVMTSIQEGFPNSVLEALSCGLFVVATRHGGTEDLLDDDMGRITNIKDASAVANAIIDVYHGEIKFYPEKIREKVIGICGRRAYKERISKYFKRVLK